MRIRRFALYTLGGALAVGAGALASVTIRGGEVTFARLRPLISLSFAEPLNIVTEPPASALTALNHVLGGIKELEPQPAALAYANPEAGQVDRPGLERNFPQPPEIVAPQGVAEGLAAYRSGDLAAGDAAAQSIDDPIARLALEWAALQLQQTSIGLDRLSRFLDAHPSWPSAPILRTRAEDILWIAAKPTEVVENFFASRAPQSAVGKLAMARALMARGKTDAAAVLARDVWRNGVFYPALEPAILKEFGEYLTWADHKYRSDRMAYKDNSGASIRIANLAGPDALSLARARDSGAEKQVAALPQPLRNDPTLIFARASKLLDANRVVDASKLVLTAPRDPDVLVSPDEWWKLRRQLSRKLLDLGKPTMAYQISAGGVATTPDLRIESEFQAGWIALRFLADPAKAEMHFARAAPIAITPISAARIAYWRGRAAETAGDAKAANDFYAQAGERPTAFYGQLALAKLGKNELDFRKPERVAIGDERDEAVRVIELLEAVNARDLATPLANDMARTSTDEAQLAALGAALVEARDARLVVNVGKLASQRGFRLEELSYPTFGIPRYEPIEGSAPKALVYAIARQESAFDSRAISSAGARGLMQMMPATARNTASHKHISYDEDRLLNDPAFNAQLGAAHLGELAIDHPGSAILIFAAYNAGGRRVREWIAAHGDPRDPNVDPIDWIELIPIAETRNYVQRIAENLEVYRARLGRAPKLAIEATLRDVAPKK